MFVGSFVGRGVAPSFVGVLVGEFVGAVGAVVGAVVRAFVGIVVVGGAVGALVGSSIALQVVVASVDAYSQVAHDPTLVGPQPTRYDWCGHGGRDEHSSHTESWVPSLILYRPAAQSLQVLLPAERNVVSFKSQSSRYSPAGHASQGR
jgi:hypothetical protein